MGVVPRLVLVMVAMPQPMMNSPKRKLRQRKARNILFFMTRSFSVRKTLSHEEKSGGHIQGKRESMSSRDMRLRFSCQSPWQSSAKPAVAKTKYLCALSPLHMARKLST